MRQMGSPQGDHREPSLPRFEARPPLPSGAGIETRHTKRSPQRSRRDAYSGAAAAQSFGAQKRGAHLFGTARGPPRAVPKRSRARGKDREEARPGRRGGLPLGPGIVSRLLRL